MLTHAFHKNAWHMSLVAGDLDFKPLVDALIELGIHVHVFYEARSAAKGLYRAADVAAPIRLEDFWHWSKTTYRSVNPIPFAVDSRPAGVLRRNSEVNGTFLDRTVHLAQLKEGPDVNWVLTLTGQSKRPFRTRNYYVHRDKDRLLQFLEINYGGTFTWRPSE